MLLGVPAFVTCYFSLLWVTAATSPLGIRILCRLVGLSTLHQSLSNTSGRNSPKEQHPGRGCPWGGALVEGCQGCLSKKALVMRGTTLGNLLLGILYGSVPCGSRERECREENKNRMYLYYIR